MEQTNREFAEYDKAFRADCTAANVPPTVRQASKYRMRKGIAFKSRKAVK